MTSEIQKKFEFEKTKNPNFATTVDAVRLLKKAVDQDLIAPSQDTRLELHPCSRIGRNYIDGLLAFL